MDQRKASTSQLSLTSTTDCDSSSDEKASAGSSDITPREEFKGDIYEQLTSYDQNLWYIHGHAYDLSGFVEKHPGGRLAILSGRGRDCTALFESYHPWNDRHRKVLRGYGPAPPAPDPFYEELKAEVRVAFPGGGKTTKMPWRSLMCLSALLGVEFWLFFGVRTPLACALAGFIMATVGTRLAHEGGHYQISSKEWVNRLALFSGYFLTGPSMGWHYRHVISHHAHTNQSSDVDVAYIWIADLLPAWLKILALPTLGVGAMFEIGPRGILDMIVLRHVGGNPVDWRIGGVLIESLLWLFVHYYFGPSCLCYLCMYFVAGSVFVPCSQVAHAILYPDSREHKSWARMQIAESADFASDSELWFHLAFGLTTQIEHHLFPGVGHHCYDTIRHAVKRVCKKHGVPHIDISAKKAFGALWYRWVSGQPMPLA